MSKIPPELGKKFLLAWKEAAKTLTRVRAAELAHATDTVRGLQSLLPAFEACVAQRALSPTSGLIEQQRLFKRARAR